MRVITRTENSDIATVYIAQNPAGKMVEFVESTQPPFSISEKWVLIVSTLYGCPVDCSFCDAGGTYKGKLSAEEILFQVDYPVVQRFPDRHIKTEKFSSPIPGAMNMTFTGILKRKRNPTRKLTTRTAGSCRPK